MTRTNLTKRTVRDPDNLRVKLAEHDTALDALDTTGTLPANSVSNTELRDSAALTVIGRSANTTGDPADIAASAASGAVLRESGSVLGFGTVATAGIADAAVTRAKLSDGTALSVVGRAANSSGVPADIAAVAAAGGVLRESGSAIGFGTIAAAGIATGAVTGVKIPATALKSFVVAAGNGAGARTATGTKVGDKVVMVANLTDATDDAADFETVITVADQIQQTGTDHSADKELVLVITVT